VQELGGAVMHTSVSGTGDYRAATEQHAFALAREIVSQWKRTPQTIIETAAHEEPYYDPKELYGIIPKDRKTQFDMREVLARIVDGSRFHEYQPDYGTTMVCSFAHIWGFKVGILANNGVLFNDSSLKAAHFMQLCNQNRTPLVFFQNITGYMVGREYEERGIANDGAKMLMAQGGSVVPKCKCWIKFPRKCWRKIPHLSGLAISRACDWRLGFSVAGRDVSAAVAG